MPMIISSEGAVTGGRRGRRRGAGRGPRGSGNGGARGGVADDHPLRGGRDRRPRGAKAWCRPVPPVLVNGRSARSPAPTGPGPPTRTGIPPWRTWTCGRVLLRDAPAAIREALCAAFDIQCLYRHEAGQATIWATTDTTPGIITALTADPRT